MEDGASGDHGVNVLSPVGRVRGLGHVPVQILPRPVVARAVPVREHNTLTFNNSPKTVYAKCPIDL